MPCPARNSNYINPNPLALLVIYALGAAIRIGLIHNSSSDGAHLHTSTLQQHRQSPPVAWLSSKVDFVSPVNSHKRLLEGVHLYRAGISPYEGDTSCNAPPILLLTTHYLLSNFSTTLLQWLYVVADLVAACALQFAGAAVLAAACAQQDEDIKRGRIAEDVVELHYALINESLSTKKQVTSAEKDSANEDNNDNIDGKTGTQDIQNENGTTKTSHPATTGLSLLIDPRKIPYYSSLAAVIYLANPFSIAACATLSTTTLENALLALTFYTMVSGQKVACLALASLVAALSLYPVILIVPILIAFDYKPRVTDETSGKPGKGKGKVNNQKDPLGLTSWLHMGTVFDALVYACFVGIWIYASYAIMGGSWEFLHGTYGFILSVPDLTPGPGVFWYFFTEMFDHFRVFFLCVFQLNILVYIAPLGIKLRAAPPLLFTLLLLLTATFKSYPTLADASVCMALLPVVAAPLFRYVRHAFIVACATLATSVLSFVMWTLWIHAGSANANFYFAITLFAATAQIFLATDLLYSYARREAHLRHGLKPQIDGREAKMVLE